MTALALDVICDSTWSIFPGFVVGCTLFVGFGLNGFIFITLYFPFDLDLFHSDGSASIVDGIFNGGVTFKMT